MPWAQLAEKQIQEAMERGDFDDLPCKGRPLDLADYFNAPQSLRMGYSILKNAGVLPAEVSLLREIETLENQLKNCADAAERSEIQRDIQDRKTSFRLRMEMQSRKK